MLKRRPNLRQYIVYLHQEADKKLIDHLEPFVQFKRGNEEVRRLLYNGLAGGNSTPASSSWDNRPALPAQAPFTPDSAEMRRDEPPPADVRQKAKKMFG